MDNFKSDDSYSKRAYGGYRKLAFYENSTIVYDLTVIFCGKYVDKGSRTYDQMVQAARSGRQNIAEGSMAAVTSRKAEIKLVGVARASLEELLLDYQDFLRQRGLGLWVKDDHRVRVIRGLSYRTNRTYKIYMSYMMSAEPAANAIICLIHQANYLLDRQIQALEKQFVVEGGYTEELFKKRMEYRSRRR
jgi:four helix bundle suffix protein